MRRLALILFAILFTLPVSAQDSGPDYQIVSDLGQFADDGMFVITVNVSNQGGPAGEATTVRLVDLATGTSIANETLRALQGKGDQETLRLRFPADSFPAGPRQMRVDILSGSITVERVELTVNIPESNPPVPQSSSPVAAAPGVINLPFGLQLDTRDPRQMALAFGTGGVALILLLLIVVIVRLLFQRPPAFGTWLPPYANMPPMNPDTIAGRRQLWQQHAQNSSLPGNCMEGSIHARKLLLGMDGSNLSGWRITALRMSQYDMYGRVARSQILAPKRLVRRLDRVVHKSQPLDMERRRRQVRPVASRLAGLFGKKLNKRNAMLPIALDVRLQGVHGEVRIVFELYQCQRGQWQQIDWWEPEMTIIGKAIHDSYTYTIFGQTGGETYREFRRRLQDDLARVLTELIGWQRPEAASKTPDTVTGAPVVNSSPEF